MSPAAKGETKRPIPWAAACGLAVATLLLYAPVFGFEFIRYDDPNYVALHPRVSQGLSWGNIRWALTAFEVGNWHPLTLISHMADVSLFGMRAGAHHAVNASLHALNAALLFLFWEGLTARRAPSLFAAALFAVHPLNVESVAWISQRKSVLCMGFLILTLIAYAAWARRGGPWRYALSLAGCAAALAAKPMAVVLPGLLLLLDYWPLMRADRVQRLLLEKVPFALLAAAASVATVAAQREGGALGTLQQHPAMERLANATFALAWYAVRMVWPTDLSLFYPTALGPAAAGKVGGAAILLVATSAAVVPFLRARRSLPFGWGWYLVSLLPVVGFVPIGTEIVADRYAYLALIGPFAAVAFGAADLIEHRRPSVRWGAAIAASMVLVALAFRTGRTLPSWRNSVSILSRGYERAPDNVHVLTNYGLELVEREQYEQGIALLARAAGEVPMVATVHVNLGYAYAKTGRLAEARHEYEAALPLRPDDPKLEMELGRLLVQLDEREEAETRLKDAVAHDPSLAQGWLFLGTLLYTEERHAEAQPALERAAALAPRDVKALTALGVNLAALGRRDEAIAVLRKATALDPGFARARTELQTLIGSGDPP